MKSQESLVRETRRKSISNLLALDAKYTVFSEHWQSQRAGDGLEIERIRDFEIDDDPDSLDLDSLSQLERNAVVHRALEGVTMVLCVDVSSSFAFYPEYPHFSKALIRDIAVCILIHSAHQMMTPVGLVLFSDRIERVFIPQSGQYARYILNQFLDFEVQGPRGTSLACLAPYMREFRDAMILVVSDFQDRALEDSSLMTQLGIGELDVIPVVIRDPLEKVALGDTVSFFCRDPETGRSFAHSLTKSQWQELQEASRRFYRALFQKFTREFHKGYIVLDGTDVDDCHTRLQAFFARRASGLYAARTVAS